MLSSSFSRERIALAAAVLGPLAVALVLIPFRTAISGANLALVLVVAVVAVAAIGNRLAGALAALSAAAWFDYFLTEPYERFTIAANTDVLTAILLLAVGLAVSQLAARANRLRLVTITDADHLAQIYRTTQLVQSGAAPNQIVNQVRPELVDLLHLRGCRFEQGLLLGRPPRLEPDGSITPKPMHSSSQAGELPDEDVELRVCADGVYYGRFMLTPTPGDAVPLQARLVAVTLADQVAEAFDAVRTTRPDHRP
ncbi:DUF4118 domain-containing protein [Dactylosporangium sp. NPDC049742]|uniref:DUF4118 domain-containing protein n=1 Tax=Dactylosporangium sp. NPDC049742 TaxID=3154737 RepID=UPI003428F0ED